MATLTISRSSATPLHDQIRRAILEQIASGELAPGDRLPTEHEYAAQFGVSLAPVRQALLHLVAAGQIMRVKGRGTFVRDTKVEETITLLTSFTEGLRDRAIPFQMRVLDQVVMPADARAIKGLGISSKSRVVRLRRLAVVGDEPAAILDARLPAARFGRLASIPGFDEGRSLYRTLEEEFGAEVGTAMSTLEVVRCDEMQADTLGVPSGTPALLVSSVTEDSRGRPVEVADVLYRADRFTFMIRSQR
jgi:GntR family transcriptional regulator